MFPYERPIGLLTLLFALLAKCRTPLWIFISQYRSKITPKLPLPQIAYKTVSASAVRVTHRITSDMADETGRLHCGELLKLVDVAAGVCARRHAETACVTICLDKVHVLKEMRVGDLIHLDACVNRAWGSSLEAGVRVAREDPITGDIAFSCHAYLTFVAIATSKNGEKGPSPALRLGGQSEQSRPTRPKLKHITPETFLEKKRYVLAARRRALRMRQPTTSATLKAFRDSLLSIDAPRPSDQDQTVQDQAISALEMEILADAYASNDPSIIIVGGYVCGKSSIFGEDAPRAPLKEIETLLKSRPVADLEEHITAVTRTNMLQWNSRASSSASLAFSSQEVTGLVPSVPIKSTHVATMRIVMPQHANTVGVLFGGQLMQWMEQAASLSAHRLKREYAWVTTGVDGLEFREAVATGEVLTFRAAVTRVFDTSIEVYCCSHADPRGSGPPRFTNECFFTLIALNPETSNHERISRLVSVIPGSLEAKVNTEATEREKARVAERSMLLRVYSKND